MMKGSNSSKENETSKPNGKQQQERDAINRKNLCHIQRLPLELLGSIFEAYVEMDESAWGLSLICKRWQSLALSSPRLWTYIRIRDVHILPYQKHTSTCTWTIPGRSQKVLTEGRFQVCETEEKFHDAISLTGSVNIHLDINPKAGALRCEARIFAALKAALSSPISDRICTLWIENRSSYIRDMKWLNQASFLRLRTISYLSGNHDDDGWVGRLLAGAYQTSRLLDAFFLEGRIQPRLLELPIWHRFRRVGIERASDALPFLDKFTRKEDVTMHNSRAFSGSSLDQFSNVFSGVKTASLHISIRHLSPYNLESLQKLELLDNGCENQDANPVQLPSLLSLRLTSDGMTHFHCLRMPSLVELHIDTHAQHQVFEQATLPTLTRIFLRTGGYEGEFSAVLKAAPILTQAHYVVKEGCAINIYITALESLVHGSNGVLGAHLKGLRLGDREYPVEARKNRLPLVAAKVLNDRQHTECALSYLDVYWQ